MVDTLKSLDQHLQKSGVQRPKIVVWAHNSHLGDARATDMGRSRGEVNVGQLCREVFGKDQVGSPALAWLYWTQQLPSSSPTTA